MTDYRILDAHMRQSYARSAALGKYLTALGDRYGYGSDEFVAGAVDGVLSAQTEQALATWNYFATVVERADPLGRTLDVEPPVDVMIGAATHDGTPLETIYRRPGGMIAELALEGLATSAIDRRVKSEVVLLADADVFVASRKAEQTYGAVDRRVVGYRRVPNSGACDWCRYIATMRYHKERLAPAHRGCHCGTEPILGTTDPGLVVDPDELARIKKAGVPKRAGSRKASAARAKRRVAELGDKVDQALPPITEAPATRLRPTAASRKGQSTMNYEDPKARAMSSYIDRLDELHGVADDGYAPNGIRVRHGGSKTQSKGGHFAPNGSRPRRPARKRGESREEWLDRYRAAAERSNRPEILINDRGDGTKILSFLHEYGHRVDYEKGNFASRVVNSGETASAMGNFLKAATDNDHFREAASNATRSGIGFAQYFRSPEEVWARAYAQWSATKLGGEASEALDAMIARNRHYQWPREQFDAEIAPTIEAVLRARGLTE